MSLNERYKPDDVEQYFKEDKFYKQQKERPTCLKCQKPFVKSRGEDQIYCLLCNKLMK